MNNIRIEYLICGPNKKGMKATGTPFGILLNTKQKKLVFFQNLILVAIADRHVDEQENNFLLMMGEQLDLSEEDTRPVTDKLSSLSYIIPEEGKQKTIELQKCTGDQKRT